MIENHWLKEDNALTSECIVFLVDRKVEIKKMLQSEKEWEFSLGYLCLNCFYNERKGQDVHGLKNIKERKINQIKFTSWHTGVKWLEEYE